jgi:hypothetical protein
MGRMALRGVIALLMMVILLGSAASLRADAWSTFLVEWENGNGNALPEESDEEEDITLLDVTHEKVSDVILASARWIDNFFIDERVVREDTETRLRLSVSNFSEEGDLLGIDLRTSLRLDLPIIGERLRLFFSGDDDERERGVLSPDGRGRQRIVDTRERSASVGIRYFFLSTLRQNLSLSTGLRFRGGSPVLLLEPRYRHTVPIQRWDLRFTQRYRAYSDGRSEIRTSFDLERPLLGRFFFRTTAEGAWFDDEDGYFYGLHSILYHPLSRNRILQYGWSNNFVTQPTHALEEIRLFVSYRQRIWRDWMFLEVSPQLAFPREEDYEISPGILLRLDMVFGDFRSLGILF